MHETISRALAAGLSLLATTVLAAPFTSTIPQLAGASVTDLDSSFSSANCDASSGLIAGAVCKRVTVSCPNAEDLIASLALNNRMASRTVVMFSGGGGIDYMNPSGSYNGMSTNFVSKWVSLGFRVVQVKWESVGWEDVDNGAAGPHPHSTRAGACRPAILSDYIFNNASLHNADRSAGFCAFGHSGGGAQISYSLALYGLKADWDFVNVSFGPPMGRIDYGCDPSLYTASGTPGFKTVCGKSIDLSYLTGGLNANSAINSWEGTTTCNTAHPPQADLDHWSSDSVVVAGADFSYPQTPVAFYACGSNPTEGIALGSFFYDDLTGTKHLTCSSPSISCGSGGEGSWNDPVTFTAMVNDMNAGCVPRH